MWEAVECWCQNMNDCTLVVINTPVCMQGADDSHCENKLEQSGIKPCRVVFIWSPPDCRCRRLAQAF